MGIFLPAISSQAKNHKGGREEEGERDRDRETHRETERKTDTQRQRQNGQRPKERQREEDKETGRDTQSGAIFSFPDLIHTQEEFEILGTFNDLRFM